MPEGAETGRTFWDFVLRILPQWVFYVLVGAGVVVLMLAYVALYPDRTKQFALAFGATDTLQASFSAAKLTFTGYEVIGEQNNCKIKLDPPGSEHRLPTTYSANGAVISNQKLELIVDNKFRYILVGGVFDWMVIAGKSAISRQLGKTVHGGFRRPIGFCAGCGRSNSNPLDLIEKLGSKSNWLDEHGTDIVAAGADNVTTARSLMCPDRRSCVVTEARREFPGGSANSSLSAGRRRRRDGRTRSGARRDD